MKQEKNSKGIRVYIPLILIVLLVLIGVWYWYRDYSRYITTDDAHVDADNVSVGTKILGRIANLYAKESDFVVKGTLLADLDSTDLISQKNQSVAQTEQAKANLAQAEAKYKSDQMSIKVLEINLDKATEDLTRAKNQFDGGVITQEQFDHINKAYETAKAQLDAAKAQLLVSKSSITTASTLIETANAQVKVVESQLKNTKLYAPADGVISKKWLMPGDVAQPSQSVFSLTISKNLWVVAYPEETKISEIKSGQSVKFTIDAFPDLKFNGKVFMVGSSTASVFSLIPASNASGNFTKVTQRIPVKISIDSTDSGENVSSLNILSGMSVEVRILKN
jgi:membrane fusion protein, multidrug efflux system